MINISVSMRILLIGEYSNVHHTLRDALRRAGHEVLLISDGDGWKDYERDLDLSRHHEGPWGSLCYLSRLITLLPKMRGYDVVQLINPDLLHLKPRWNRWFFRFLKRSNKLVSVGCFGDDYYVIQRSQCDYVKMRQRAFQAGLLPAYLEYTDFYAKGRTISHPLNEQRLQGWVHSPKAELTRFVMSQADCLVACLYEYYKVYDTSEFAGRIHYIPLPLSVDRVPASAASSPHQPVKVLLSVQKRRASMKGTDQMEPLFQRLAQEYPQQIQLQRVESVPFAEYCRMLDEADVVVDQLYSYTPAMNALESMARGKVVVSGGEEDYYRFQEQWAQSAYGMESDPNDEPLRPIINLRPFEEEQNYQRLKASLLDASHVARLQQQSREFVQLYHHADRVAAQYLQLWQSILK